MLFTMILEAFLMMTHGRKNLKIIELHAEPTLLIIYV